MILPWRVDVPEERRPVMNWLIIGACVVIAWLQFMEALQRPDNLPGIRTVPGTPADPNVSPGLSRARGPGITETYVLKGWGLKGLFGSMWLHGGLVHLLGNMWFLWIFGNAVCAKVGNIRYLVLYVFFGVAAALAHLLTSSAGALGASGAIFGVVGMYLVLFYENRITCYLFFWFIFPIIRQFTVGSIWMILFWAACNVFGVLSRAEASRTAYFAHLGGFSAGFAVAWLMCRQGWITMERYEKSLLQLWQEYRERPALPASDPALGQLGLEAAANEVSEPQPVPVATALPKPAPCLSLADGSVVPMADNVIRATCSCGKTIETSRQYEGKVVRCPACKGVVMMPQILPTSGPPAATPPDGHTRFACPCGQRIKMPARYAGRWGKCPQCGDRIRVPRTP